MTNFVAINGVLHTVEEAQKIWKQDALDAVPAFVAPIIEQSKADISLVPGCEKWGKAGWCCSYHEGYEDALDKVETELTKALIKNVEIDYE